MSDTGFGSPVYTPTPVLNDLGFGSPFNLARNVGFGSPPDPALTPIELARGGEVVGDDGGTRLDIDGTWYDLAPEPVPSHSECVHRSLHSRSRCNHTRPCWLFRRHRRASVH